MENLSLLGLPDIKQITSLSRTTIYNLVKDGRFPRPRKIPGSRRVAWVSTEIHDWVKQVGEEGGQYE